MAVDTIVRLVAGLTLPFLSDGIERVCKPVTQLVLSLNRLDDSSTAGRRRHQYTVRRSPRNTEQCASVAVLTPGVLVAFGTGHIHGSHVLLVFVNPVLLMRLGTDHFDPGMARRTIEGSVPVLMTGQTIVHDGPVYPGCKIRPVHARMARLALQFEDIDVILVVKVDQAFGTLKRHLLGLRLVTLFALIGVRHLFRMAGFTVFFTWENIVRRDLARCCVDVAVCAHHTIVIQVRLMREMDQGLTVLFGNCDQDFLGAQRSEPDYQKNGRGESVHSAPLPEKPG
jgi:hypothetical protein